MAAKRQQRPEVLYTPPTHLSAPTKVLAGEAICSTCTYTTYIADVLHFLARGQCRAHCLAHGQHHSGAHSRECWQQVRHRQRTMRRWRPHRCRWRSRGLPGRQCSQPPPLPPAQRMALWLLRQACCCKLAHLRTLDCCNSHCPMLWVQLALLCSSIICTGCVRLWNLCRYSIQMRCRQC